MLELNRGIFYFNPVQRFISYFDRSFFGIILILRLQMAIFTRFREVGLIVLVFF